MNPELYNAAIHGRQDFGAKLKDSTTDYEQLITSGQRNTILHIAAESGKLQIEEGDDHVLRFLYEQNKKGDTPLHIAAKLGNLEMTRILVAKAKKTDIEQNRKLLSMGNHEKDTALHVAVRHNRFEVVKLLIEKDKGLASIENVAGESPLFIAVDRYFFQVAFHILDSAPDCSLAGRSGMNVLHAAVIRSHNFKVFSFGGAVLSILRSIFRRLGFDRLHSFPEPDKLTGRNWVRRKAHMFLGYDSHIYYMAKYLLKSFPNISNKCRDIVHELLKRFQGHLIMEKADDFGWIPLHYAAFIGHKDLVDLLLANGNGSLALTRNKQGMSALHISAEYGHVDVIKLLMEKCPEICELLDEKDQTALHVAVEKKRKNVVKCFLQSLAFQDLVNEKDKNGNTALHLAASMIKDGSIKILIMLARDSNIDKMAVNKAGMTFVDIVVSNEQLKSFEIAEVLSKLEQENYLGSLEYYVRKRSREGNQSGTYGETKNDEIQVEEKGRKVVDNNPTKEDRQKLWDVANINLVIITIVASVSFAAMFTLAVEYKDEDLIRGRSDFKLFILFDSLSFVFASTSMVLHLIVPPLGKLIASRSYAMLWILVLTLLSVVTMILAFQQGVAAIFHDKSDQVIVNATRYGGLSIFIALISLFIGTAVVIPVVIYRG
ncbi:hypothetical protein FNV43_RR25507 [Rhamnella rubrinervis]|uniref:PGG domain-containing protein n=1 Tax=Rhamnella rubrinervis TaxID=2594499 RepID=A0A8K0DUP9_9ROSA|nr:hypothetical protein FNV43_RR25507 [Rhamnella rubrinervis]